jgi:hypothetical protein
VPWSAWLCVVALSGLFCCMYEPWAIQSVQRDMWRPSEPGCYRRSCVTCLVLASKDTFLGVKLLAWGRCISQMRIPTAHMPTGVECRQYRAVFLVGVKRCLLASHDQYLPLKSTFQSLVNVLGMRCVFWVFCVTSMCYKYFSVCGLFTFLMVFS